MSNIGSLRIMRCPILVSAEFEAITIENIKKKNRKTIFQKNVRTIYREYYFLYWNFHRGEE